MQIKENRKISFHIHFKDLEQLKSPMSGSNKRNSQKVATVYKEMN